MDTNEKKQIRVYPKDHQWLAARVNFGEALADVLHRLIVEEQKRERRREAKA